MSIMDDFVARQRLNHSLTASDNRIRAGSRLGSLTSAGLTNDGSVDGSHGLVPPTTHTPTFSTTPTTAPVTTTTTAKADTSVSDIMDALLPWAGVALAVVILAMIIGFLLQRRYRCRLRCPAEMEDGRPANTCYRRVHERRHKVGGCRRCVDEALKVACWGCCCCSCLVEDRRLVPGGTEPVPEQLQMMAVRDGDPDKDNDDTENQHGAAAAQPVVDQPGKGQPVNGQPAKGQAGDQPARGQAGDQPARGQAGDQPARGQAGDQPARGQGQAGDQPGQGPQDPPSPDLSSVPQRQAAVGQCASGEAITLMVGHSQPMPSVAVTGRRSNGPFFRGARGPTRSLDEPRRPGVLLTDSD